jgi:hypothetical protein
MKLSSPSIAAALVFLFVAPAVAQTPAPAAVPAPAAPAGQSTTVPVPSTKRVACLASTQGMKGQDKNDQMQLCMAQGRLDCLKQAIDQKLVGPQRKEFIQSCVGTKL